MATGNSVVLQLGKETTYGTKGTASEQILISSESFKEVYNKIDEGVAVGGRGTGKIATMGIGAEGSYATIFRPDMGNILKGALGVETVTNSTEGKKHSFTAIGNEASDHLPAFTYYIDRKVGKFAYPGCKINVLTLSAENGGYLTADISLIGKKEETVQTMKTDLTPSQLAAFRLSQAKVYVGSTEIADVKSISLEINNNLSSQEQTTSTGNYYKEPEVGMREISASLSMIYTASVETLRTTYYKADTTFSLKIEFTSDEKITTSEKYKMTITLPCCQLSDATANMAGLNETIPQNVSVRVCDNLSDELITIDLINADTNAY